MLLFHVMTFNVPRLVCCKNGQVYHSRVRLYLIYEPFNDALSSEHCGMIREY
jgi:hypothetical protein